MRVESLPGTTTNRNILLALALLASPSILSLSQSKSQDVVFSTASLSVNDPMFVKEVSLSCTNADRIKKFMSTVQRMLYSNASYT